MNNKKVFVKISLLLGFLLFAAFSAYFTATSLSLSLMGGQYMWLIFVLVLIVASLAGWFLSNAIDEMQKPFGASRAKLFANLIGFLVFWGFSFTTNVHYFFVEKHGYNILVKELTGAKKFIKDETINATKGIIEERDITKAALTAKFDGLYTSFEQELKSTIRIGFGPRCISILKSAERELAQNSDIYGDQHDYNGRIFHDENDKGDIGLKGDSHIPYLQKKYIGSMVEWLEKKLNVIDNYYNNKINENSQLASLLDTIQVLEKKHLPLVLKDGSATAYYRYSDHQNGRLISKLPIEYKKNNDLKTGKEYIYPSEKMFDTISVWKDIFSDRMADMTMLQWILIALIFDVVSFILLALFCRK